MDLQILLNHANNLPIKIQNVLDTAGLGVLVIDMQEGMSKVNDKLDDLVTSQLEVLGYCCKKDIPVFFVKRNYSTDGDFIPDIKSAMEIIPRSYSFEKDGPNAFRYGGGCNLDFIKKLDEYNISALFLMGIYSCACVRITAITAMKEYNFGISSWDEVISDPKRDNIDYQDDWKYLAQNSLGFFTTIEEE